MENKVYCKNCKFSGGLFDWLECHCVKETKSPYSGMVKSATFYEKYKDKNDDGACPFYQRKWWKFWVKQ